MKTFSDFLDTLGIDDDGRTATTIVTPEGLTVAGPAFTGDDLFPSLRDIRFEQPTHAPPAPGDTASGTEPTRRRTRLEDKHARRRRARADNQRTLDGDAAAAANAAPPVIETPPPPTRFSWEGFGDEPPF